MHITLVLGLGLAFGAVFEKYHLCLNSTVSDVFISGDTSRLRGLLAALLVSGVLFNLLIGLQATPAAATPLFPTTIAAGILFGVGMNLAGGCVSGTMFRWRRAMSPRLSPLPVSRWGF